VQSKNRTESCIAFVYLTIQAAVEEMPSPDDVKPPMLKDGAIPSQDEDSTASE